MSETGNGHGARRRVFTLGDTVRIKTGVFSSFTGKIEGINQSKMLLKVKVAIFGRTTPVKLHYTDVEKIAFTED
jgi:transcriptional antiterminator NusG